VTVSGLGERGVIDLIWSIIESQCDEDPKSLILPPPDDASAIALGDGACFVLKTDMFVKRTDAPRGMTHRQMGAKALVMNISDLAAKGAVPKGFLFSLGLPPSYRADDVSALISGICSASKEYGTPMLGGDVGESRDLVVAGFAVGLAKSLVKRSGAAPGDVVAVTGKFGDTGAAFKILLDGMGATANLRRRLCRSVYRPKARLAMGLSMARTGAATSSMDSSDGLAFTLNELAKSSRVGFIIDSLPISADAFEFAHASNLKPADLALFGGEEYEIIYTVRADKWEDARRAVRGADGELQRIGSVVSGHGVVLRDGTNDSPIPAKGWEHLRSRVHHRK
jgi:thiamine-monophosphate kinase